MFRSGLVKVSSLRKNQVTQRYLGPDWNMFHKIYAIYRDLKHQETLQASIPKLKFPGYISPPHPYQLSEPSLPGKLQEVPPDLLDFQPFPSQVWNFCNIGFYPNGNRNKMLCTYKLFTGCRVWRTQTGERAPFWCTALISTRAFGQWFVPPMVVHLINNYNQDLH